MAIIEIKELCKTYGKDEEAVIANDKINLTVNKGEFLALIGLNGAGKTTLIRMLSGILEPDKGSIYMFGKGYAHDEKYIKSNIGVVLGGGEHSLYGKLSGMENMEFFGSFYNLSKKEIRRRSDDIFNALGLSDKKNAKVETYSMGMKQKMLVAKALLHDPEILILDEPCNGIDVITNLEIKKLLRELNENGKTIILTTHNLNDAEDLCSTVCILQEGKIVTKGTFEDVYKPYYSDINIELKVRNKLATDIIYELEENEALSDVVEKHIDDCFEYNFVFKLSAENAIATIINQVNPVNLISIAEKKLTLEHLIKSLIQKEKK